MEKTWPGLREAQKASVRKNHLIILLPLPLLLLCPTLSASPKPSPLKIIICGNHFEELITLHPCVVTIRSPGPLGRKWLIPSGLCVLWTTRALISRRGTQLSPCQLPKPFHSIPQNSYTLELFSECPSSPCIGIPPYPEGTASLTALSGCPLCYWFLLPDLLRASNAPSSFLSWDFSMFTHSLNNLSHLGYFVCL